MKNKKICLLACALMMIFLIGSVYFARTKLTYLELKNFSDSNEKTIILTSTEDELTQQFTMPYNILDSISLQIGTFQRRNNSNWLLKIQDENKGIIYEDEFNASQLVDNEYYIHKLNRRIGVKKGEKYSLTIKAKDIDENSFLAFYTGKPSNSEQSGLFYNGTQVQENLCFKVCGGNTDYWWFGCIVFITVYLVIMIIRIGLLMQKGKSVKKDKYIQAMLLGMLFFVLMYTFSVAENFCDESDNMYGGMVIARGGVLYRDYVTQHTPVMYYICSMFALLGAKSIAQFRISYYILLSLIWCFLYKRHVDYFGKKKIFLLCILEVIGITSVVPMYGTQVLSDGFQGFLLIILLLEYLRYYDDKQIDWKRSIILSICIWGCIGVAFISVYALIWIALMVLIIEWGEWRKTKLQIKDVVERYYKFVICLVLPLIITIIYFKKNHALLSAFKQFYIFNRTVYPKYQEVGESLMEPFINAVQNFVGLVTDNSIYFITGKVTSTILAQTVIIALAVFVIVKLFSKKKWAESIGLFLPMIFSATRGYGFHGLAAWYVAILIIAIYVDLYAVNIKKENNFILAISAIILLNPYVQQVGNNLKFEQTSVSEIEDEVITLTENDEDKNILLDVWTSGSLYYFYKDRYPVNKAVFFLPWYMEWFEKDNIKALNEKKPRVVVYNENEVTWQISHYTEAFANELKKNYTQRGNEGWQASLWIRNE